ncbi:MAG: ribosomal RNA small subunit methyltransferase A [Betaproteobacteria bacterium]|nr:ribosomal RNA small subunit methyltransferase A [Betaproteobacteria bacterium]
MKPRKRFGQHFLRDDKIIAEIVRRICPRAGENILEIGPGDGALTAKLLEAGAALTAVEIDRSLAEKLRARFGAKLNLINGDALQENLSELLDGGGRAAGNLPYNISTPLLLKLAESGAREMWLMLQEEVAARICAPPGAAEYGRLTVSVRLFYDAEYVLAVPPRAFSPPPKVNSAVIKLSRRAPPPRAPCFSVLVAAAFQSRRKMLGNGLSDFSVNWRGAEISPQRRPQTLSPEEFARLSFYAESAA